MNVCLCATPVRMTCVGCVMLCLSDLSQDGHPVVFLLSEL